MANLKDILVTTTSSVDGIKVKQYLKPISAHIVTGTNLFSDFVASLTDLFGGRSQTYQKQLSSIYNEAIERLRVAAYEIGANCIIGLKVDLDEISGKGKSMFMITAIGTAVIIDDTDKEKNSFDLNKKFENADIDKLKNLKRKREIITKAAENNLNLDDENWNFIISNQISEVYDFILSKLKAYLSSPDTIDSFNNHYKRTISFLDTLPMEKKLQLLYGSILKEENEQLVIKLCNIIEELQLLDFAYVDQVLHNENFQKQKQGIRILMYDKSFYNKLDIDKFRSIIEFIKTNFPERGVRSMKKQLLSSKEKEVWTCDCKNVIEIGKLCGNCKKDIYGFTANEITPLRAIAEIEEKISLISEYLE